MGEITEALRRAREESTRKAELRRGSDERPDAVRGAPARSVPPVFGESPAPLGTPVEAAGGGDAGVHIPDSKQGPWAGRAVLADEHGRFAVHFRQFALRVGGELERRGTRAVLVTSAVNQDGKTTVACNLALAMASMAAGRRVALVELDLRRPAISQALGVPRPKPGVGFGRVLRGEAALEEAVLRTDAGVDLFLIGKPVEKAHEILARPECGASIRALARSYDQIVFDAPPVLAVPDVSLILPHVDACLTVARAGATPLSAFRAMTDVLPSEKIIGAFVNNAHPQRDIARYDYYYDPLEDDEAE